MNTAQLYAILLKHRHTKDMFDSVLPGDCMPLNVEDFPAFFIVNRDTHSEKGSHWCAICFPDSNSEAELFDSLALGVHAYPDEVLLSLKCNSNGKIKTNHLPYQTSTSSLCGEFCLWYIDLRCQGLKFEACMKLLSNTALERNERMVERYAEVHMSHA